MKTAARLASLCLFAVAGVGLAVWVGTSAKAGRDEGKVSLADRPHPKNVFEKGATDHALRMVPGLSASAAWRFPEFNTGGQAARGTQAPTILLPPLPAPMLGVPVSLCAREVVPTPNGEALPNVLESLRKKLTEPPAPPPPTPPAAAKSKTAVDGNGNGKLRIHIYDEDIRKVLELLGEQGNLNILASRNVVGKVSATLYDVDIQSALGAILKSTGFVSRREGDFLFVGTTEDFDNIDQAMDRIGTRTYRTNYVAAAELKTLITPLLTEKVGVVSVSTPAEVGIATNDSAAGGDSFSGDEVLVVRDYEAVLDQIDQLVAEVDIRPMQVSIEAMILSVKLQDEDNFGVNFQLLRDNPNIRFGLGSPAAAIADVTLDGGLKFGFIDTNLGAFLEALEQVGDTIVIANPRLMVLNKQRAEIQIGKQQGYINQTITETTSAQSVEFLDTGTQLRLRPFISSDGMIRMEVHPELSDGNVELKGGFTLPNKTITQTTTNVMVHDGCTVVIGGLIHEQLTNSTTQIPVLGNLPFIGFAFRQTKETTERREVLVLITPRIVHEPGTCMEGENEACEFLRRQSTYADKMSPFGKRSIGRRYYRLAESAYAAGDMKRALWLAEMSVQFDPLNRAALNLRSDICLNKPYEEHAAERAVNAPLANPLDGQPMPDWLIDDLENAENSPPAPLPSQDLGAAGRRHDPVRPNTLQ